MDKALRYAERMAKKVEKFKENNERDKNLARIFKEVENQNKSIAQAKKMSGVNQSPEKKAEEQEDASGIKDKLRRKKTSKRNNNKHLKLIELGDQIVMIDSNTAENENNRAEKQCQDNNLAFYAYKKKDLFPNKIAPTAAQKEAIKNRVIIDAFKKMQESVKLRNVKIKNKQTKTLMGDPPLAYPYISQQIDEKQKLRKLMDQLELEKCLDEGDSDFNDFDSVASDRVKFYEDSYRQMMKQVNVPKKSKIYFKIHKKHLLKQQQEREYQAYQQLMHEIKQSNSKSP